MNHDAKLQRILGLGFGIALAFGNTIGVGILRLPGQVADALGNPWWVFGVWCLGGLYALLGALNVSELAAMMPAVGGFYVYAKRAFGSRVGFLVGWNDWVLNIVTLGFGLIAAAEFFNALLPDVSGALIKTGVISTLSMLLHQTPALTGQLVIAFLILLAFAVLHWNGVVIGSHTQNIISASVGVLLVIMAVGGFFVSAPVNVPVVTVGTEMVSHSLPSFGAMLMALRLVIVSYDGWYGAIYMAGETKDAERTVPKAMISCALLVMGLYVLINAGFLHALGMEALRHSTLPAADVARALLPVGADRVVTAVSLLTVLSLINATMMGAPRVLLAVAQDGLKHSKAATVSTSGTPRHALFISVVVVMLLIVFGSLNDLIAIAGDLFVLNYITAYSALLWLRLRSPELPRPFTRSGYPLTTGLVLLGSVGFWVAALWDDPKTALAALGLLSVGVVVAFWLRRQSLATEAVS